MQALHEYPDCEGIEVRFLTEEETRDLARHLSEIEDSWFVRARPGHGHTRHVERRRNDRPR